MKANEGTPNAPYWMQKKLKDGATVNELFRQLQKFKPYDMYARSIWLCVENKGLCAYCGTNMLTLEMWSNDIWHLDHLLPQDGGKSVNEKRYPELVNDPMNHVLACKPCNCIKSGWDPNYTETGATRRIYEPGDKLTVEVRSKLIERVRMHIQPEIAVKRATLQRVADLLKKYHV